MTTIPLGCARALRDGGIHAVAALNASLEDALAELPEVNRGEFKLSIARLMGNVLDETVNRAVQAHPELEPDEATWKAIVKARSAALAAE